MVERKEYDGAFKDIAFGVARIRNRARAFYDICQFDLADLLYAIADGIESSAKTIKDFERQESTRAAQEAWADVGGTMKAIMDRPND